MNGKLYIAIIGVLAALGFASSASISNKDTLLDDVTCNGNGNYLQFDPNDCSMYYECNNGKLTHKSCGFAHKFDEKSNKCQFVWWIIGSADCSKVNGGGSGPTPKPTDNPATKPTGITQSTGTSTTGNPNGSSSTTTAKPSSAAINSISVTLGMILMAANRVIV